MAAIDTTARKDHLLTLVAISAVALMFSTMLHEGIGHGLLAMLTGATSGTLSTVAWSSDFDSRLVAAGGTLVNLAAGVVFWLALRAARNRSSSLRFFLFIGCAFNLFTGTGYFFFSGVTNFGDWAAVIAGMQPYWLWRAGLVLVGVALYYGAMVVVGTSLVRYLGVGITEARFRRLTVVPYVTALMLEAIAGIRNPVGIRLVFESALAATAGANCGLLFMQHYLPKSVVRGPESGLIRRSYGWIVVGAALALGFILILGPGVSVHR
jgi:preprotein translocase subunit SecG